ncbi:hypothetical protein EMIT0P395_210105 [Pseudomonas sp. IT-P395]
MSFKLEQSNCPNQLSRIWPQRGWKVQPTHFLPRKQSFVSWVYDIPSFKEKPLNFIKK